MSRSEGRTGEYERDERARDLHVDRYVSESDRTGSAVLPAALEFERGRPGLRFLFESRERESLQQRTPRLIIWVVCRNG